MEAKTETQIYDEYCSDCPHNPNAKKPYAKMKHIRYDKETVKMLEENAKEKGKNENCLVCKALHSLMLRYDTT
jgi:predicted HicB family RNase H-like nuclease